MTTKDPNLDVVARMRENDLRALDPPTRIAYEIYTEYCELMGKPVFGVRKVVNFRTWKFYREAADYLVKTGHEAKVGAYVRVNFEEARKQGRAGCYPSELACEIGQWRFEKWLTSKAVQFTSAPELLKPTTNQKIIEVMEQDHYRVTRAAARLGMDVAVHNMAPSLSALYLLAVDYARPGFFRSWEEPPAAVIRALGAKAELYRKPDWFAAILAMARRIADGT